MLTVFIVALVCYVLFLLLIVYVSIHPARSPIFLSPSVWDIQTENVSFESEGINLLGWWIQPEHARGIVVLAHGYVMNRAENVSLAAALYKKGFACLLFDSRACGKSGGAKVGFGWLERNDIKSACAFAKQKLPNKKVFLCGSSMGAAACVFAISEDQTIADGLVLDSAYHDLANATLGWWDFVGGKTAKFLLAPAVLIGAPLAGFNPFRVNVGNALKKNKKPVLIIHGTNDSLVPVWHAKKNFAEANNRKQLELFDGCGHSEMRWVESERFHNLVCDFIEQCLSDS